MRSSPSSGARNPPAHPPRERSKKHGTLASWRTDQNLKLVGVTRRPGVTLRALPVVGQVIVKTRRRTGFLDTVAHLQALQGKAATYRFQLFRRHYEVRVAARRDRRKRIIGVRGTLQQVPAGRAAKLPPPSPLTLKDIARLKGNSLASAIRALELAKAVAEAARAQAQIRNERATALRQKAEEARLRAEDEGRRARMLADISAVLDSSFDHQETLNRVGRLLVLRTADWCVLYARKSGGFSRLMLDQRDPQAAGLLEQAFPAAVESGFLEDLGQSELFPVVTPEHLHLLAPKGARRRAIREINVQSLMRTPITSHGQFSGVLIIGSNDPGRLYNVLDLHMARDVSRRIALAWESSRLYEEAQKEIALRREVEARLRVFNVELERRVSERTAMLEEATREANSFAYTVAHDLRAPLRAITGFCQALKEDYSGVVDAVGKDYLERVVHGARRMDDLIRDLLDYARLNRAEIRKGIVDLEELLPEVLQPLASELDEKKAKVQVDKPLGRVVGQGLILSQALTNLISNAVKFVAPDVIPEVRIRSEENGTRTRILVEDNGIGIATEHQERIFGIFERLNRAELYPGTGIGLAIVRRAVERLGGSVGVESTLGQGSRFWIELPSA
ncbi:MAG TPA: ATP-binding protein [Planctomycetota bacterium]|nr:ATP-binding protein [Planctomycetota bacterium]